MTHEINLDDIGEDIQALDKMFFKYQIDPVDAYDHDLSYIEIPDYYRLENLMDNLEELGAKLDELSNGFYKVLMVTRSKVNRTDGSYNGFFKAEKKLHKSLNEKCKFRSY